MKQTNTTLAGGALARAALAHGASSAPADRTFTPTEQQFAEWCERHDLPAHLNRDAFDDAASLHLDATSTATPASAQPVAAAPTVPDAVLMSRAKRVVPRLYNETPNVSDAVEAGDVIQYFVQYGVNAMLAAAPAAPVAQAEPLRIDQAVVELLAEHTRLNEDGIDEFTVRIARMLNHVAERPATEAEMVGDWAGAPSVATDDAKDAARYRWLRNSAAGQFVHPIVVSQHHKVGQGMRYIGPVISRELDRLIDAAMSAQQGHVQVLRESAGGAGAAPADADLADSEGGHHD